MLVLKRLSSCAFANSLELFVDHSKLDSQLLKMCVGSDTCKIEKLTQLYFLMNNLIKPTAKFIF